MMVKFNMFNFLWVYLASISFYGVNKPSAACKIIETLYLKCKLTLFKSTPSICTQTRPNCDKNILCLAKHVTQTNIFYTGMPVVPVTNSMSVWEGPFANVTALFSLHTNIKLKIIS